MSKYIIELGDSAKKVVVIYLDEGVVWTGVQVVEDLEILNSDYINEHFGDLQDTAYRKGRESVFHELEISGSQKGESADDAWEAARKIIRMSDGDILDLFPDCYASVCTAAQVILKYDASEAIAKLKAYEEKQKADDEIKVGDEVNWLGDCFIVTRIFQPHNMKEQCDGIDDDGCVYHDVLMDDLEKTGRHFDIKGILEALNHD